MGRIVAIVALIVAVAGIARTADAGSEAVISACYATDTGLLRVADAGGPCVAGREAQLSWSEQAPAGPIGPVGDQGPAGRDAPPPDPERLWPGERARKPKGFAARAAKPTEQILAKLPKPAKTGEPTDAFTVKMKGTLEIPFAEDGYAKVATLAVPAGTYFVTARAFPEASYFAGTDAHCRLQAGNRADEQFSSRGYLVLTVVGRLTKPGLIELRCFAAKPEYVAPNNKIGVRDITAITLAKATGS